MRRGLPLLLLLAVVEVTQVSSTVVESKWKNAVVEEGGGTHGYIAGEKGNPGIVLVHEWWGITQHIKDQAEELAAQGFRVMIPNLFQESGLHPEHEQVQTMLRYPHTCSVAVYH